MNNPIINIETECLFLRLLTKCEQTLDDVSTFEDLSVVPQDALMDIWHYIEVLDIWLNPNTESPEGRAGNTISPEEVMTYISDLCGEDLPDSKAKQKIRDRLPIVIEKINRLENKKRGGRYEQA